MRMDLAIGRETVVGWTLAEVVRIGETEGRCHPTACPTALGFLSVVACRHPCPDILCAPFAKPARSSTCNFHIPKLVENAMC